MSPGCAALGKATMSVQQGATCTLLRAAAFSILILEVFFRGRKKFHATNTKLKPIKRTELNGGKKVFALVFCFSVVALSFFIPIAQLIYWCSLAIDRIDLVAQISMTANSLITTLVASLIVVIASLIVANFNRFSKGNSKKIMSKITSLGYSIPGNVIAMGVITLFILVDRGMIGIIEKSQIRIPVFVLSGSMAVLVSAYLIRFLSISYNSIEAGFEKTGTKFHEASRTLGFGMLKTFVKVDFPMIRPSILSGFLLVFIDILKELPLTLILRPFNYNTLATKAFEYSNDEMLQEASLSSLLIIALCVGAILFVNRINGREKLKNRREKDVYKN